VADAQRPDDTDGRDGHDGRCHDRVDGQGRGPGRGKDRDGLSWPVGPMLAVPGKLPLPLGDWAYEVKWDGVRALARTRRDGTATLAGRAGTDLTSRYPELAGLAAVVGGHDAVVDGEIVTFTGGRPDFQRLQHRIHTARPTPALVQAIPARLVLFDLLHLDGRSLMHLSYARRRDLLDSLRTGTDPAVEIPDSLTGLTAAGAADLLAATAERGLEGLVAKRCSAPYRPGVRSPDWVKLKNTRTMTVTIGGWKPGHRHGAELGALLVGVPLPHGPRVSSLRFVGAVGSGLTEAELDRLAALLARLRQSDSPFDQPLPPNSAAQARWAQPILTGEITYSDTTHDGHVRHPVWRGLTLGSTGSPPSLPNRRCLNR
jgi:bifunctional non-homologous end joining protein LigD